MTETARPQKTSDKTKVWHDEMWTCLLVNDGVSSATVSLTRPQAAALRQSLVPPEAKQPGDSHGDGGEAERLSFFAPGHVMTDANIADLNNLLADWNDEIQESANSFNDGYLAALRELGGDALVDADEEVRQALAGRAVRQMMAALAKRAGKADQQP